MKRLLMLGFGFCVVSALADQITMKNGDRLTGTIVKVDAKNVTFKSEYAGVVTLPWESVSGITSGVPVYVGLKTGQVLAGTLALLGEKAEVASQETGTVSANRDTIVYIRSKEEQASYDQEIDRYRNPRLVDLWTGYVDLGISEARGNAIASNINTSAAAARTTGRDKIAVAFTSLYNSSTAAGKSLVTANAIRGGIRYELNIAPQLFTFGSTDLEYDEFQGLDLRFAPAGGFGYHLWKTSGGFFDVLGGASMNREFFIDGLKRTSGEGLAGQELHLKLNERTTFAEKLVLFPNLTKRGEYRANFDLSATTAFWRWFGWQFTASDRLLSNPVPGRKRNDILFTTGFRITFAR